MKSKISLLVGFILLLVSAYGIFHGVRSGLAQIIYFQSKYGSHKDNPKGIFRRCEDAHRLYPYNHYFCVLTAETVYNKRFDYDGKEMPEYLNVAQYWCDTGLDLNFYKSQLRLLKTRLLQQESVTDAIKYWENYVDWEFWDPYNHAVLVELYAEAGDFSRAMESLALIKESKRYAQARKKLQQAWQREMALPPEIMNDK